MCAHQVEGAGRHHVQRADGDELHERREHEDLRARGDGKGFLGECNGRLERSARTPGGSGRGWGEEVMVRVTCKLSGVGTKSARKAEWERCRQALPRDVIDQKMTRPHLSSRDATEIRSRCIRDASSAHAQ